MTAFDGHDSLPQMVILHSREFLHRLSVIEEIVYPYQCVLVRCHCPPLIDARSLQEGMPGTQCLANSTHLICQMKPIYRWDLHTKDLTPERGDDPAGDV